MSPWPRFCEKFAAALAFALTLAPVLWVHAAAPHIPTPRETENLRALVNVDDAIVVQNPLNFGPESLITDMAYFARGIKEINSGADVYRWIHQRMPSATIGRYHSSRFAIYKDAQVSRWQLPDDAPEDGLHMRGIHRIPFEHYVPAEQFSESELLPAMYNHPFGMRTVDFRQPEARAKLTAIIVDNAARMGAKVLMTDEWVPAATWDDTPWIDVVISYEAQLTKALHERGIAHLCNMHFRVGGRNDYGGTEAPRLTRKQLTDIAANCDGLLIERPCDPEANPLEVLADYQTLAATGKPCVLIGTDLEFLAGLAMLTSTDTGPLNYVAGAVWQPEPNWLWLPARLGDPTAPVKWLDTNTAMRLFEHGKVVVQFDQRKTTWYTTNRTAMNYRRTPAHTRHIGHRRR